MVVVLEETLQHSEACCICVAAGIGDDVGCVCQQMKEDVVCTLVVLAATVTLETVTLAERLHCTAER